MTLFPYDFAKNGVLETTSEVCQTSCCAFDDSFSIWFSEEWCVWNDFHVCQTTCCVFDDSFTWKIFRVMMCIKMTDCVCQTTCCMFHDSFSEWFSVWLCVLNDFFFKSHSEVCCSRVLQSCVAVVCCSGVLQSCVAVVCCSRVLQSCVAVVCCSRVLQWCVFDFYFFPNDIWFRIIFGWLFLQMRPRIDLQRLWNLDDLLSSWELSDSLLSSWHSDDSYLVDSFCKCGLALDLQRLWNLDDLLSSWEWENTFLSSFGCI